MPDPAEARPARFDLGRLLRSSLPLRLALLALLLRPGGPWYARPAVLAIAIVGLLAPGVAIGRWTWLLLALLSGVRLLADWPLSDNHQYLIAYACLAAGLALGAPEPWPVLARSARLLIGLTFLFASLWKGALAPEFLDGRFFRVTLLTDPRFTDLALLFGGLDREQMARNRELLAPLPEGAVPLQPVELDEPAAFRRLVAAATWGALCLETAIALAWLMPAGEGRAVTALRHGLLLGFVYLTYAFAPVAGFAWILVVLGLAACPLERRGLRLAYLVAFLLVLFYEDVPWAALVLERLRG